MQTFMHVRFFVGMVKLTQVLVKVANGSKKIDLSSDEQFQIQPRGKLNIAHSHFARD